MNPDYEIYQAPKDKISPEDAARLEGYLKGREEGLKLLSDALKDELAKQEELMTIVEKIT